MKKTVPMFQSECCPREIRGAVVASYQLMITIGILVSNAINLGVRNFEDSDASWRIVIGLGIAFSLPLGIGVLFSPESPRWLAGRSRWDEARTSLARLRGMKDDPNNQLVEGDYQEMYAIIAEQNKVGEGNWLECFTGKPSGIPRLVYRTFLGVAIHFLQQWTGVNYFFYVSTPASSLRLQSDLFRSTVRRSSRPQVFKIPSLRSSFLVRSTSSRRSQACTSWSDMDDADQCSSALCGKLHGFASSLQSAQHSILRTIAHLVS